MRTILLISALALALAGCGMGRMRAVGDQGLSLRQEFGRHGALALNAGSAPVTVVPEVHVLVGFRYSF